jgi:hypothetical protein
MPKVFVSWSGPRSKIVANAIRESLPLAIQSVKEVFLSSEITKGLRWSEVVATELATTDFGIVCVTPENMGAPWLNFEAGALSKHMESARVMTLLIGLENIQVTGPLSQFQHTTATRDDMERLMTSLNEALGEHQLEPGVLARAFKGFWNEIESAIASASTFEADNTPQSRSVEDMVEELLGLARAQAEAEVERRRAALFFDTDAEWLRATARPRLGPNARTFRVPGQVVMPRKRDQTALRSLVSAIMGSTEYALEVDGDQVELFTAPGTGVSEEDAKALDRAARELGFRIVEIGHWIDAVPK